MRTWFDQPGRKLRRRQARKTKAAALGVRPLKPLRPAVRAPTVRYNTKLREGRGFTFAELKEAGIGRKAARGLGIVVDHRRRNLSEEGKALNVERLVDYRKRLIVFPKKAGKPKKGDSTVSEHRGRQARAYHDLRAMTSIARRRGCLHRSHVAMSTKLSAKSPKKNASSKRTVSSATSVPTHGTRARGRFGPPRCDPSSSPTRYIY